MVPNQKLNATKLRSRHTHDIRGIKTVNTRVVARLILLFLKRPKPKHDIPTDRSKWI